MHPFLEAADYKPPEWLRTFSDKPVVIGDMTFLPPCCNVDALPGREAASISCGGFEWMTYNFSTHEEALELYSQYRIAEGHCVCTGLGLGVREQWLLRNPKVTKITVIEKSADVIEFHRRHNPETMSKIEVVHGDASEAHGVCDTLLLDHYIYPCESIIPDARRICSKIIHERSWWWPLEDYILCNSPIGESYRFFQRHREREMPTLADVGADELYSFLAAWTATWSTRERREIMVGGSIFGKLRVQA